MQYVNGIVLHRSNEVGAEAGGEIVVAVKEESIFSRCFLHTCFPREM